MKRTTFVIDDIDGDPLLDVLVRTDLQQVSLYTELLTGEETPDNVMSVAMCCLDADGIKELMTACAEALGEKGMANFVAELRRATFTSVDANVEDAEVIA